MLAAQERRRLTEALGVWLQGHPEPDEPAFRLGGVGELSPREVVAAVSGEAVDPELGDAILDILEFSVRRSSLDEVAASFERKLFA